MTSPTPAELQAMRALAEKATQGQWKRVAMGGVSMVTSTVEPKRNGAKAVGFDERNGYSLALPFFVERTADAPGYFRPDIIEMSHDDASFIAAAHPQAVIALIDALVSARAALRGLLMICGETHSESVYELLEEIKAARACLPGEDTSWRMADARAHLGGQDRKEG